MSTFTQIRAALAGQISTQVPGLRGVTTKLGNINPPCAVVLPAQGTSVMYARAMGGQTDFIFRVVLVVSPADTESGQDKLDTYIDDDSVWQAVQSDPTLGGVVSFAGVTEVTGYGVMNIAGVDYMTASFIVEVGDE